MRFHEIIKCCKWQAVRKRILTLYGSQKHNLPGYKVVFEQLRDMPPAPSSDYMLFITTESWNGDEWVRVNLRLYKGDDSLHATDFMPWNEILAMEVFTDPRKYTLSEIVAHVLFDITFWGFSEKQMEENEKKLDELAHDSRQRNGDDD